jgi:hypothetical protein
MCAAETTIRCRCGSQSRSSILSAARRTRVRRVTAEVTGCSDRHPVGRRPAIPHRSQRLRLQSGSGRSSSAFKCRGGSKCLPRIGRCELTPCMGAPTKRPAFLALQLRPADRKVLAEQTRDGRPVSARVWKRIRILELLDEDWTIGDVAVAVGTSRREVRRVGWRFLDRGVGGQARSPARTTSICGRAPRISTAWSSRRPAGT